ncbi:hypothetical protein HK102_009949, partial [Quaeritorhiza haematococci]
RCIRITGINNQSHIIDVADLAEARLIRDKIFNKFGIMDEAERQQYALFVIDHNNKAESGEFFGFCLVRAGG